MPLEILNPFGRDRDRWLDLIDMLPAARRDIHFRPEYAAVQSMLGVASAVAALTDQHGGVIIQPFVIRNCEIGIENIIDISSPYGYGGPISNATDHNPPFAFFAAFSEWCKNFGIVDEYCVLHPFTEIHQRWLLREDQIAQHKKDVTYIWLIHGFDQQYRRDRRAGIARAVAAGVTVERVDLTPENVRTFCDLYRDTMLRKLASVRWYFPEEYLRAHFDMGADLASLFFARIDGEVEVASLVLHAHSTAYYHLTGNRMAHPKVGANDLLVHEIATWAMARGYDKLHLGGGLTSAPGDSLLEYKAGFSKFRAPVYSYFRIFDDKRYAELCAAKRAHEIATLGREIETDFTPRYLAEVA